MRAFYMYEQDKEISIKLQYVSLRSQNQIIPKQGW